MIKYVRPTNWIKYNFSSIQSDLLHAMVAIKSLTALPLQKSWAEELQKLQLKREIAGTSRIEGAEFTDEQLELSLRNETPQLALDRSQKQARAAMVAYAWLSEQPSSQPLTLQFLMTLHGHIVRNADDDHCLPGSFRGRDQNVTFGSPPHRGAEGGIETDSSVDELINSINTQYKAHESVIQAFAAHYHIASIHPFQDGNGRTARALEAFMLRRAGLNERLFIAQSNYYYDNKNEYLTCLAEARSHDHELTTFLKFALRGVAAQCERLNSEILHHVKVSLYRDQMQRYFGRLEGARRRVIRHRQVEILEKLLDDGPLQAPSFIKLVESIYSGLSRKDHAVVRDLRRLEQIKAIYVNREVNPVVVRINLDWPSEISLSDFDKAVSEMPEAKTMTWLRLRR